jgi:hypothetical protein
VSNPHDQLLFERFLAAVHRRMVLLRAVERVGLCVLGACVVALVLMPILVSRGESTGGLVGATLGMACFVGLLWAVISRPSKLAAAAEVDRQLRLADLLATALMLPRDRQGDEMERAVLAVADARCRQASASAVVLNRLGARSWGGIGLALALVMGLNLLGPDPARSANRTATSQESWLDAEPGREQANPLAATPRTPDLRRVKAGSGADEDPASAKTESTDTETSPSSPVAANPRDSGEAGDGGAEGAGAGAAQSKPKSGDSSPLTVAPGTGGASASAGSVARGGGSGTAADPGQPGGKAGSSAGGEIGRRRPAPVWQSERWAADREAAGNAIRDGRVPDEYRDVVRGYFQRD